MTTTTFSVASVAKFLDLTERRIQQLVKEGVLPKPVTHGKYDIAECNLRYIRYLRGLIDGEAGDLASERTRLTRAQAEKTEIETARMKGELVSLADAERGWSALVGAFRSKILILPALVSPLVVGKPEAEIERILIDKCYEALSELSNWKPSHDDDDPGTVSGAEPVGESGSAAAKPDGQSVGGRKAVPVARGQRGGR